MLSIACRTIHPFILLCLCLALASCTQGDSELAPATSSTITRQTTGEKKTVTSSPAKRRQDSNNNHEGILLTQADTDGDDRSESIAVCETASICVNHPASGINHTYTNPHWDRVILVAVQDTDGQKGTEIVVVAQNADGVLTCICIIHDHSQTIASYLGPHWSTATVKSVIDTDGQPGDEVVLVASDSQLGLQCACIIRDRDGTYQTYMEPSWASIDINWVEDIDAHPGAEVVLEVRGTNGITQCVCVIHHPDDRFARYSDLLWQTAVVQMLIDMDGTVGSEIVVIYATDLDGGVSTIQDRQQSMKTIAFTGDHPSIQQVGNYDKAPGAELCVLLTNQHRYELINIRSGEHVKVDSCQREPENGRT